VEPGNKIRSFGPRWTQASWGPQAPQGFCRPPEPRGGAASGHRRPV